MLDVHNLLQYPVSLRMCAWACACACACRMHESPRPHVRASARLPSPTHARAHAHTHTLTRGRANPSLGIQFAFPRQAELLRARSLLADLAASGALPPLGAAWACLPAQLVVHAVCGAPPGSSALVTAPPRQMAPRAAAPLQ